MRDPERKALKLVRDNLASFSSCSCARVQSCRISGGRTNILVRVSRAACEHSQAEAVAVRFYGPNTSAFISRERELAIISAVTATGLGKRTRAKFPGGRIEDWVEGKALVPADLKDDRVQSQLMRVVAELHATNVPKEVYDSVQADWECLIEEPSLEGNLNRLHQTQASTLWWLLLKLYKELVHQYAKHSGGKASRGSPEFAPTAIRKTLVAQLEACEKLKDKWARNFPAREISPFEVVLAHNDLLAANILDVPRRKEVALLDFEYAGPAPRAFDLANHFCEHAGYEMNLEAIPQKEEQLRNIRMYLREVKQDASFELHDMLRDAWLEAVQTYMSMAHLIWALWAYIQHCESEIEFDYLKYANVKLEQALDYVMRKD